MRLRTAPEGSDGFEARKACVKVVSFIAQTNALEPCRREDVNGTAGLQLRVTSRGSEER